MISLKSCSWQLLKLLRGEVDSLLVLWIPRRVVWVESWPCCVLGQVSTCSGLWDRYCGQHSFSYLALSPEAIPLQNKTYPRFNLVFILANRNSPFHG